MKYITGIHALNLNCELNTCGDWHQSGIQWDNPCIRESDDCIFKDYGLEYEKVIPCHSEKFTTANHIRALLDLLVEGNFAYAQGMKEDFICNDDYTEEIFSQVIKLKVLPHWDKIDIFMGKEYLLQWVRFKENIGINIEDEAKVFFKNPVDEYDRYTVYEETYAEYISKMKHNYYK